MGVPLKGHTDRVTSVAFSPDSKHIVSGSYDKTIQIWDAKTGQALAAPLKGHSSWVYSVAFSPNGKHIISGSYDKTVRIWNARTGKAVGVPLEGHTHAVRSVAFSPNGKHIVSGSYDKTICIWNAETKAMTMLLTGHTEAVASVAFSPDGKHIISGSWDRTLHIWDAEVVAMPFGGASFGFVTPRIHFSSNPHHALYEAHCLFENAMDIIGDWRDFIQVQEDGWILGPYSRLLLWVPPMYLPGLYRLRTKHLIGIVPMELDLSNFAHGPLWESCMVRDS